MLRKSQHIFLISLHDTELRRCCIVAETRRKRAVVRSGTKECSEISHVQASAAVQLPLVMWNTVERVHDIGRPSHGCPVICRRSSALGRPPVSQSCKRVSIPHKWRGLRCLGGRHPCANRLAAARRAGRLQTGWLHASRLPQNHLQQRRQRGVNLHDLHFKKLFLLRST